MTENHEARAMVVVGQAEVVNMTNRAMVVFEQLEVVKAAKLNLLDQLLQSIFQLQQLPLPM